MNAHCEITELLADLTWPEVTVGVRAVSLDDTRLLFPTEATITRRAVPQRRAEFATGRALVRSLLTYDGPIEQAASGAPVWPAGRVGTLAHDREWAVAAVAASAAHAGLGIDIEPIVELDAATAEAVSAAGDRVDDPLEAFVAKEAVYKAWSGLGGELLEFSDVTVRVRAGSFVASVRGRRFTGRIGAASGRLIALTAT